MSHFVLFHWIMMQIFIAHTTSETVVRGVMGQPVQLPCFYQMAQYKDIPDMCWGRGPCPNSKCNGKILHTTGSRVTFRISQRYSLQGYISYGDVSLTIGAVTAEDEGTYCCRIEIPGWFNDIKQNMRLEVVRAPPVMTTTTRKVPVSPKRFRKTTFAPEPTSDHQATTDTAVFLTTTVPPETTATTASPAEITLETIAPTTFAVTTNEAFPETMMTPSALPDFSTEFQAADMSTEDDYVFYSDESVPLPGGTKVTPRFPSTLPTAEGTGSADTTLLMEDLPAAATTLPEPTMLQTPRRIPAPSGISTSSDGKAKNHDDNGDKFPSYATLIACPTVVSILFILMLVLFWKRKHTNKFIIKRQTTSSPVECHPLPKTNDFSMVDAPPQHTPSTSHGAAEDLEKVFSGAEGENTMFSL
ncbi:T-cell immunoglobulin and mucin domain-containing protein 4-like isoform X2 [Apus apus]|uniref:T-cell immunoglobulin and mucin domain-containing protein 4-like isoform X2 n=1 Tax=Apus apus TaxID=8895 RepID=UPI0021F83EF7|nr:T-cell immunoglobulin and mucin domain-containing protein 4-like isoform X2 [Apus apus]